MKKRIPWARKIGHGIDWLTALGGRASPPLARLIRFTCSGLTCFSIDMGLLRFFTESLGIHYLVSAAVAFIIAITFHYLINRNWAFKGTERGLIHGYAYFVGFALINMLLMLGALSLLVEVGKLPYMPARMSISVVLGIVNFVANSKLTFKTAVFRH